jgi:hypothetical protein
MCVLIFLPTFKLNVCVPRFAAGTANVCLAHPTTAAAATDGTATGRMGCLLSATAATAISVDSAAAGIWGEFKLC